MQYSTIQEAYNIDCLKPSKKSSKNPDSRSKQQTENNRTENRNDKDSKGVNQHIWGK